MLLISLLISGSATRVALAQSATPPDETSSEGKSAREAALGLARIARLKLDYVGALRLLDEAASRNAESADLLAEYGQLYLAAEEPQRARGYFDAALKIDPACEAAVTGLAGCDLLERDYNSAESRLREWLAQNPDSFRALAVLSRVYLEDNRNDQASQCARRALTLNAYDVGALYALAYVKATERKPDEVRALARRALALDPLNAGARRLLSQYLDGRAGYNQRVPELARKRYERGAALKQQGEFADAVAELEAALRVEPRYYRALIALGDIWLRQEDYERAATAARLAIEVEAEGALAQLELSYAHAGMQERARIALGARDFAALYYKQPAPPAFELTSVIFPNYKSLTRRQQIVIDAAVAPLAQFLPALARRGARYYLLPFDRRVIDVSGFDDADGEVTFDGRYYASIRGVGGRITVSGIECADLAARGGFNTIAHEFAHQVHSAAMGKDALTKIRKLYEQALREGRALDYYAAADEFEYFAQGYEAFISHRKRPSAGVTARHTNQELAKRDPDLRKFLSELSRQRRQAQ